MLLLFAFFSNAALIMNSHLHTLVYSGMILYFDVFHLNLNASLDANVQSFLHLVMVVVIMNALLSHHY